MVYCFSLYIKNKNKSKNGNKFYENWIDFIMPAWDTNAYFQAIKQQALEKYLCLVSAH